MRTKTWVLRMALIGVVGLLKPACNEPGAPVSLFLETWDGGFPGTSWGNGGSGSANNVWDPLKGNPAPSLRLESGSGSGSVVAMVAVQFDGPSLTGALDMAAEGSAADQGVGIIRIKDQSDNQIAYALWDVQANLLTFTIMGATDVSIAPPSSFPVFHRFVFKITSGGSASWSVDNGAAVMTHSGISFSQLKLDLVGSFTGLGPWANFYFDNVSVTSP